ncbi:MAG: sporulation integral membrane protein YtvI [Oscillospiraceae bacterium]|nr:sporulation integral membrane protein YtvI [Oscillospiraceae bacterium]
MMVGGKAEYRLTRIINVAYYLLILVGFYLFMRYAFWLVFPFLFSFFVAMLLQRPMNYALRKIKLKKSFSAVSLVLIFYLTIAALISLVGMRIVSGVQSFASYITGLVQNIPESLPEVQERIALLINWMPASLQETINGGIDSFVTRLLAGETADGEQVGVWQSFISNFNIEWLKTPMNSLLSTASKIPAAVVAVVITVVSSFFMTSSYDSIVQFIKRQLSVNKQTALSASKRIMLSSLARLVRSYLIIVLVTFGELLLGLGFLIVIGKFNDSNGSKYWIVIAFATALVDMLPVIGTGSVLMPWAIYNMIMGNIGMGVGLIVMYVVIIIVRQIIEPKLIAANLGLPAIATLAGMYIGLQLFGVVGMFVVPLLLILLKLLNDEGVVHLWKTERSGQPEQSKGDSA